MEVLSLEEPSGWSYVGEGGKHAIFRHSESWKGFLLRMRKCDLARSRHIEGPSSSSQGDVDAETLIDPVRYIRTVVAPLLQPYVDVPRVVMLSWDLVKTLREETLAKFLIPNSRRESWFTETDDGPKTPHVFGLLVRDYRFLSLPLGLGDDFMRPCIAIEVKPKAGYLAFSPLVDPPRRIKYRVSRFTLLQDLYCSGHLSKAWTTESSPVKRSNYEPLNLFSGDKQLIRQALKSLFDCPQNNLKAWVGNKQMFLDRGHDDNMSTDWHTIQTDLQIPGEDIESTFLDLLAEVLAREALLPRLLQLQKLDILDADGAILVYNQMLKIHGSRQSLVESMLDDVECGTTTDLHHMLVLSPFVAPQNSERVTSFCNDIESFQSLQQKTSSGMDMDDARERILAQVEALESDECRYLLQTWLLSLAACDVSFFIAISSRRQRDPGVPGEGFARHQSETATGVVVMDGNGWDNTELHYQIKVIDCDQKPSRKLRDRHTKENMFDRL